LTLKVVGKALFGTATEQLTLQVKDTFVLTFQLFFFKGKLFIFKAEL
jgi:hypothetical protein